MSRVTINPTSTYNRKYKIGDVVEFITTISNSRGYKIKPGDRAIITDITALKYEITIKEGPKVFTIREWKKEIDRKTKPSTYEFRVGDIITGLPGNPYGITTENAVMRVEEVNRTEIVVKILEHKTEENRIGFLYTVDPKYFIWKKCKFPSTKRARIKVTL